MPQTGQIPTKDEIILDNIKTHIEALNTLFSNAVELNIQLEVTFSTSRRTGDTVDRLDMKLKNAYKQLLRPSIWVP